MTGNGVMHNGTTILDEYGHNLDRLKVCDWPLFVVVVCPPSPCHPGQLTLVLLPQAGDTVGVVRKEDGSLHFFVNGVPQGPAAWNVPPSVYAVVDLYGQAAQATIMDDMGEPWGGVLTLYLESQEAEFIRIFCICMYTYITICNRHE